MDDLAPSSTTTPPPSLSHEIFCSLPRPVACRTCSTADQCGQIVTRSPGRLQLDVKPLPDTIDDQPHELTGRETARAPLNAWPQGGQLLAALVSWGLLAWGILVYWIFQPPSPRTSAAIVGGMVAVFTFVIVGVPTVRRRWADRS